MYDIIYTNQAKEDIARLKRDEPTAIIKLLKLVDELMEHPRFGTGKPEQLSGRGGQWSRRISRKHRLIYEIYDSQVVVLVLSAYGHYGDK